MNEGPNIDEEGLPYNEKDLPFEGNIQLAIRSGSQADVRKIMKWRNKYRKEEKSEEKMVDAASPCQNEIDYVTQEDWNEDNKPSFFVKYIDEGIEPHKYHCYNKEYIINLGDQKQFLAAAWVPMSPFYELDDEGFVYKDRNVVLDVNDPRRYSATSSIIEYYVIFPDRKYINYNSYINSVSSLYNKFVAVPIYTNRVSNVDGSFGVGASHGQLPGETIYYLIREDPVIEYNEIYINLMKMKTGVYAVEEETIVDTFTLLQEKYIIPKADQEHYWLRDPWYITRERFILTDYIPYIIIADKLINPAIVEDLGLNLQEQSRMSLEISDRDYKRIGDDIVDNNIKLVHLASSLYTCYTRKSIVLSFTFEFIHKDDIGDREYFSLKNAIAIMEELEYKSNIREIADKHKVNKQGIIISLIYYLFREKYTLWIGVKGNDLIECVFASSFYMQYYRNKDVNYRVYNSLHEMTSVEFREVYKIIYNNEILYNGLLLQVNNASIIKNTGLYIDDIMIVILTALYSCSYYDVYPAFLNLKFLGFCNKRLVPELTSLLDIYYAISMPENVLIESIMRQHRLFSTMLRVSKNFDICNILARIRPNRLIKMYNGKKYIKAIEGEEVEELDYNSLLVMSLFIPDYINIINKYIPSRDIIMSILRQNNMLV